MVSLGLGTTGKCNMNCSHCYSRKYDEKTLTLKDVQQLIDSLDIESVNFGTGENILNPEFLDIIELFFQHKIPMSLTTNGYSASRLDDYHLKMFHDIDFSLEYPSEDMQNRYRGNNSWRMVTEGMERCKSLSIPVSIATVLMKKNVDDVIKFTNLLKQYNCYLRLNVIKPSLQFEGKEDSFLLGREDFWKGIKKILSTYKLVSCSEPVLCAALGINNAVHGTPCGQKSMRIQPDGTILPCVYWNDTGVKIKDALSEGEKILKSQVFANSQLVPQFCMTCRFVEICGGGCASRRLLGRGIEFPDEFCPLQYGEPFPKIEMEYVGNSDELIHSSYLCTIILAAK